MDSGNNTLEDSSILDTNLTKEKEIGNVENVLNVNSENIKLECDVLRRLFIEATNFEDNISYFIGYFRKTFHNSENHKPIAIVLISIFETVKESDKIQNLIKALDTENINEVILNTVYLQKIDSDDSKAIFKHYLRHLSIEDQSMFFNSLFKFSKAHQDTTFLCLILEYINITALTHETSVAQTEEFWIFLTNSLANCQNLLETQKVIFVLVTCANLFKNAKLEFQFLNVDNDEKAWNAFLALVQLCNCGEKELLRRYLELLEYLLPLHFFWQYCVLKILAKRVTNHLISKTIIFFLKQSINAENLQELFEIIFPLLNKHECSNIECPVFKELNSFCEKLNVKHFPIILEEIFKVSWNFASVENVVKNILVVSKTNLIEFSYFYRFEALLNEINEDNGYWPDEAAAAIIKFFGDSENFDNLCQIRRSSIKCYRFCLLNSENLKYTALKKILELSDQNSDDLKEIKMYFCFIQGKETYGNLIKNHQLSIHVRIVIYELLFTMSGYYYAECELDQEKTINDFYEYLVKHLNEKTYVAYRDLMSLFLELMDKIMSFEYPEKTCLEILNIMRNPELYTKYQIYCAADIFRWSYYRFEGYLLSNPKEFYIEIAQKWKNLILETEDDNTCKEGLYHAFVKGQLNANEINQIVTKLLEKHLCNGITEEIYDKYLDVDLMNFALKRLNDIMEHNSKKYKKLSKLFCEAVFSKKYVNSNKFGYKNEELKFCFSNSQNLQYSIFEIDFNLLDSEMDTECRSKIVNVTVEIYLHKLSKTETRIYCLHVLMRIVSRCSHGRGPPAYVEKFKEDVKFIMNKLKENFALNLQDDINKLRITQALFLLIPYVMDDFNRFKKISKKVNFYEKLRHALKRIAVGILVKESKSENKAARQICQHMYILLSEHDVSFEDIKSIIEKIKEKPDLVVTFIPVLYHVMPFCKFSENEIEDIFASIYFLSGSSDNKLKLYSQILFQHVYKMYNNEQCKNIIEKYKSRFEQIDLDIERNKKHIAKILEVDYLFLKVLDPIRDHSLETLLYTLPKLNQVDSSEWENSMKYNLIWYSRINEFSNKKDKSETLKKSVDQFLETQESANSKYAHYSVKDILEMFRIPTQNPAFNT